MHSQVLQLRGIVYAVNRHGDQRRLRLHDQLRADEQIVPHGQGQVTLQLADGSRRVVPAEPSMPPVPMDVPPEMPQEMAQPEHVADAGRPPRSVLEGLAREARLQQIRPEAGLSSGVAPGESGGGHNFVRVARLLEPVPAGDGPLPPLDSLTLRAPDDGMRAAEYGPTLPDAARQRRTVAASQAPASPLWADVDAQTDLLAHRLSPSPGLAPQRVTAMPLAVERPTMLLAPASPLWADVDTQTDLLAHRLSLSSDNGPPQVAAVPPAGGNSAAEIAPQHYRLTETPRTTQVLTAPTVSDADPGEARLAEQAWTGLSLQTEAGRMLSGVRYQITAQGTLWLDTRALPPMTAHEVAHGVLPLMSQDGSAERAVPVSIQGENDPGRLQTPPLYLQENGQDQSLALQPLVLDADPGEDRLREQPWTDAGPLRYRVYADGSLQIQLSAGHPQAAAPGTSALWALPLTTQDGTPAHLPVEVATPTAAPVAPETAHVQAVPRQAVDLQLLIDQSGSMMHRDLSPDQPSDKPRLFWVEQAIGDLVQRYQQWGDVRVNVVLFGSQAYNTWADRLDGHAVPVAGWVSPESLKQQLFDRGTTVLNVNYNENSNYPAAWRLAQQQFAAGSGRPDAHRVSYFLSDGLPNEITPTYRAELAQWHAFLRRQGIEAHVVGIGRQGLDEVPTLDAAAAPQTLTRRQVLDAQSPDGVALQVDHGAWLSPLLHSASAGYRASGHLAVQGGAVQQLSLGQQTWRFDGASMRGDTHLAHFDPERQHVTLLAGALTMDVDLRSGAYQISQHSPAAAAVPLGYRLQAPDGTLRDGELQIVPQAALPMPVARWHGADLPGNEQAALSAPPGPLGHVLLPQDEHQPVRLHGGSGPDKMIGGRQGDWLHGGPGRDVLLGEDGDDMLFGGPDADLLLGGMGQDALWGGPGDDTLIGSDGNDRLTGGPGRDVFKWYANTGRSEVEWDQVLDFQPGEDVLDLRALSAGGRYQLAWQWTALPATAPEQGGLAAGTRLLVSFARHEARDPIAVPAPLQIDVHGLSFPAGDPGDQAILAQWLQQGTLLL